MQQIDRGIDELFEPVNPLLDVAESMRAAVSDGSRPLQSDQWLPFFKDRMHLTPEGSWFEIAGASFALPMTGVMNVQNAAAAVIA